MTAPQDHKGKQPKVKEVDGGRQVTFPDRPVRDSTGKVVFVDEKTQPLVVTVPLEALDDFELLDDLRAVDVDQNLSRLPSLLRRLLEDDYATAMNALRNEKGRVTIEAGTEFIRDVFGALNPN